MNKDFTAEQIREAKSLVASLAGRKGGRSWWDGLSEEERAERIRKMVESRRLNRKQKQAS